MAATSVEALLSRAKVLSRGQADTVAGQRELIRQLVIVLALAPFTRAMDAPPGDIGRPSEEWPTVAQRRAARARSRIPGQRVPLTPPPAPARRPP